MPLIYIHGMIFRTVTDSVTNKFIDTGKVSNWVIIHIAKKIKQNKELTKNEEVIFYSKTAEINEAIIKLK
jgi:hypothetical protein